MNSPNYQWIVTIIILTTSVVFYAQYWAGLLADPRMPQLDFRIFYTAGRLAATAPLSELYDLDRQRAIQHPLIGAEPGSQVLLPFNHPPFRAPLLGVIVDHDFMASYWRWVVLMATVTGVASLLLTATYYRAGAAVPSEVLLVGLGALIFFPGFISLTTGQDTALMLLGAAGCAYALTVRHPL